MTTLAQLSRVQERLEDLCREIGTLLLTFTPLDAVLWGNRPNLQALVLTFVFIALLLICGALISEFRRGHG